ncbi:MAG: potassium channel family protein [Alphaproteobacteria bacterium]|jgi:voltage-gated potassium channel|uniref:potassium channel family protein n=1 Tax=Methyloceanibacter sp. TaxID=1965321 RepID=UPI0035625487
MTAAKTKSASAKEPPAKKDEAEAEAPPLRERLRLLYHGRSLAAHRFRYALLAFDIVTVLFIIATSFMPREPWIEYLDLIFGLVILADFCARIWVSPHPAREFTHPATWADMVAIFSFLAPIVGEGLGFLRVLRTLRLLHTYQLVARLRADSPFFRRNEETITAVINLIVFVFVMTGIVYETQHWRNPAIANYVDALYFTVTALTTTGFGDITLQGSLGRLTAVVIMIFGVTLFLRLLQTLLRPQKVRFPCPKCGLQRHEVDSVCCKACGTRLNIPDEGRF